MLTALLAGVLVGRQLRSSLALVGGECQLYRQAYKRATPQRRIGRAGGAYNALQCLSTISSISIPSAARG
jgi:hypothetical protein